MMHIITDLGDLSVLIPVTLVATAWLWWSGQDGTAFRLAGMVALCTLALFASKLFLCGGWTPPLAWPDLGDLRSPSGHAGISAALYGALAVIVARDSPRLVGVGVFILAAMLVAGITYSRVHLHVHTRSDVIAGLAVGLTFLCLFTLDTGWRTIELRPRLSATAILLLLAAALLVAALGLNTALIESLCWS